MATSNGKTLSPPPPCNNDEDAALASAEGPLAGRRLRRPGLARARRARLSATHSGMALTREAEEILFAHAELLSEGASTIVGPCAHYFGTSMFTVDLRRVLPALRLPDTPQARRELAERVEGSMRVRIRAMRWARAEAARRVTEGRLGSARVETRVHLGEWALQIDVDLEAPIEVLSRRSAR